MGDDDRICNRSEATRGWSCHGRIITSQFRFFFPVYRIHRSDEVETVYGRVVIVSLEVSCPDVFGGGGLVGKGRFADRADELLQRVIVGSR